MSGHDQTPSGVAGASGSTTASVDVDGVRIEYEVSDAAGRDAPGAHAGDVVLVHGITESRRTWDPLIARFTAAGHRVVAIDLRGHGGSGRGRTHDLAAMAGDLGTVLAATGSAGAAEPPLLVGHSLGGAVVSAAAAGGVPCRGIVNVDQPLALGGFQEVLAPLEPALRGTTEEFRAAIAAMFDAMSPPLAGDERRRVEGIRRADQTVVLDVWDLVLTAPVAEIDAQVDALAGAIDVPYLALHGIDPGPEYPDWLAARLRTATVEVWDDHGHYPHLVAPDRFVERVLAFDATVRS